MPTNHHEITTKLSQELTADSRPSRRLATGQAEKNGGAPYGTMGVTTRK